MTDQGTLGTIKVKLTSFKILDDDIFLEPMVFIEGFDDDSDFNRSLAEDYDLTPSTVSDDSSFSFQEDLTPTTPSALSDQSPLLPPPQPPMLSPPAQPSYWSP